MPLSPWQDGFLVSADVWGRFSTYTYVIRTPPDSEVYPAPGEGEPYYVVHRLSDAAFPGDPGFQASVVEAGWTDYPGDEPPRGHIQFLLGPVGEDPPVPLRPPLFPPGYIEAGGDFAPIPGGGGAYVVYEDAVGELLGYDWQSPPEIIFHGPGPLSGTVELIAPSDYFTHGGLGYNLDDHPEYPLPYGTPASSFGGTDPVGSTLAPLPDPGPVLGFAVTVNPILSTAEAFVAIDLGAVYSRVRMPRWKYWVDEEPEQRWRQRKDGLGMSSSASWRNATDNAHEGNRWRGYL